MSKANKSQVGGEHYTRQKIQHWDYVAANDLDYFQGQITKYVSRWKDKNGLEDLKKAQHFLTKYIEIVESDPGRMWRCPSPTTALFSPEPGPGYVDQG